MDIHYETTKKWIEMPVMRVSDDFDEIVKRRKRERNRELARSGRRRFVSDADITRDLVKEIRRINKKEKYVLRGL